MIHFCFAFSVIHSNSAAYSLAFLQHRWHAIIENRSMSLSKFMIFQKNEMRDLLANPIFTPTDQPIKFFSKGLWRVTQGTQVVAHKKKSLGGNREGKSSFFVQSRPCVSGCANVGSGILVSRISRIFRRNPRRIRRKRGN